MNTLLLATEWIVAITVAFVVLVIVVAGTLRRKPEPVQDAKPDEGRDVRATPGETSSGAEVQSDAAQAAARTPTAQVPALSPRKVSTLEVQALAPSSTGEVPMLDDPEPLFEQGSGEAPRLSATYRTAAANELAQAIQTMACPKCKSPTFAGRETPEDESGMFSLEGRCGACGHKAALIDMRV